MTVVYLVLNAALMLCAYILELPYIFIGWTLVSRKSKAIVVKLKFLQFQPVPRREYCL
jgi:hypothetical protein